MAPHYPRLVGVDLFSPLNIKMDALTVFNKGGSLDMTDEEAIATASIGLQLYTEVPIRSNRFPIPLVSLSQAKKAKVQAQVPMDPKYKSEVLLQRGAEALAKEKVPLRLVAGRSEKIYILFVFGLSQVLFYSFRQDMLCPPAWASSLKERVLKAGSIFTFNPGLKMEKQKKKLFFYLCKLTQV